MIWQRRPLYPRSAVEPVDEKQRQLRAKTVVFLSALADKGLRLVHLPEDKGHLIKEVASINLQRYFVVRSFARNDRFLVAAASVFLAAKVCDVPIKLHDVARALFRTLNDKKSEEMQRLQRSPEEVLQPLMEHILVAEEALLNVIGFDFSTDHSLRHLEAAARRLGLLGQQPVLLGHAADFLTQSLKTTLFLQYRASTLAHAALYQVAALSSFTLPVPDSKSFTEFFGITQEQLDDIIPQFMAMFTQRAAPTPTPAPAAGTAGTSAVGAGPSTSAAAGPSTSAAVASAPPVLPPQSHGPPRPTFRPIILQPDGTSRPAVGPSAGGSAPTSAPAAAATTTASASAPSEEGELRVSAAAAAASASAVAAATAVLAARGGDGAASLRCSDAPGSGERNNFYVASPPLQAPPPQQPRQHEASLCAEQQQQQQQQQQKRAREDVEGAVIGAEEAEVPSPVVCKRAKTEDLEEGELLAPAC